LQLVREQPIDPLCVFINPFQALNPTDWKHIGYVNRRATIGCDFAGIIEEVGDKVERKWNKGDRVCGFVHGGNVVYEEGGAFGEFVTAKGDILMRVPDTMSFEEAATLGVGIITCGQGLYQALALPWPNEPVKESFPILIYGGSSATGMHGIQFAKA
jgi:NADPH:quinone reductase-like Zn-dependent oxidoreductase